MKNRKIILCLAVGIISCICLFSCGDEKQAESINRSPDIYPSLGVEYEYNTKGVPKSATVFKGEKVFCKYEYIYDKDGVLEKRIEKDADDVLVRECEYEDGKTLKYETLYSADEEPKNKLEYDENGFVIKRTNYVTGGQKDLEIEYDETGLELNKTLYTYYDSGELLKTERSDKDGIKERTIYYINGKIEEEWEYSKNQYTGREFAKCTEYDNEGNVVLINEYEYNSNNSNKLKSHGAYREDLKPVFYRTYDENGKEQRYIEYDGDGIVSSLKCYGEHGMVHHVIYELEKVVSWYEYKYDENGKYVEKIEHSVEGIYIPPQGSGTEIVVKDAGEYINYEEWSYPDNVIAKNYFISSNLIFEEGDTVPVDKLMTYFILFEISDKNDSYEVYEHLEQYVIDNCALSIPKEIVNSEIEKHFSVKVDGSESEYTDPENKDCYRLNRAARGGMSVAVKNYTVDGNRSIATYALYDDIDHKIHRKAEICIENEDSEEDFKIIYVREVE
ncbi:MAG: hypothetical protein IJA52_07545 [Clostridia bacterium]|nr:hypothetical protein [Clostridia bacterium]